MNRETLEKGCKLDNEIYDLQSAKSSMRVTNYSIEITAAKWIIDDLDSLIKNHLACKSRKKHDELREL